MRHIIKSTIRFYVVAAIWLLVMLGTAWTLTLAMDSVYASLGLDPAARMIVAMSLGILTATIVAGLSYRWLRGARAEDAPEISSARPVRQAA